MPRSHLDVRKVLRSMQMIDGFRIRLFQGMGPTELPRVEEGKAPDFSVSIAWMAKPGPVASKT
jgi:hypothetical protein